MKDTPTPALSGEWTSEDDVEIARIADRYRKASGVFMKMVLAVGKHGERHLDRLPDGAKASVEEAAATGLQWAFRGSEWAAKKSPLPRMGGWASQATVAASGFAGGFAGLASAVVELPFTVVAMFGAIRKVAIEHGFDPADEDVKLDCIRVFGSAGPLAGDDGSNTAFVAQRLASSGIALNKLIASVAPRFALLLTQKLGTQAYPILGAVAGTGVNVAFVRYFQEMAHVRFALKKMALRLDPIEVERKFRIAAEAQKTIGRPSENKLA